VIRLEHGQLVSSGEPTSPATEEFDVDTGGAA